MAKVAKVAKVNGAVDGAERQRRAIGDARQGGRANGKASVEDAVLRVLKGHGRKGCKRSTLGAALVTRYKARERNIAIAKLVQSGAIKAKTTGGKGSGRVGRPGTVLVLA